MVHVSSGARVIKKKCRQKGRGDQDYLPLVAAPDCAHHDGPFLLLLVYRLDRLAALGAGGDRSILSDCVLHKLATLSQSILFTDFHEDRVQLGMLDA